jgi:uncharacterized membrane protein
MRGSSVSTTVKAADDEPAVADGPGWPRERWDRLRAAAPGRGRQALRSPCTWLVTVAFVVYAAFAYNQYRQLQVGACDLGIFYQAVQGWAFHGWPYVPIKGYVHMGDHFSPIFVLLAPFLWIYNSPLVIVMLEVALLISSAIPIYLVVTRAWGKPIASFITAAYLLSIGIQGSVAFPVHEVMFSAPLIAWGLERALAGKWTAASILIGSLVFVKEDFGLLAVMFAIYALRNGMRRHAAAVAGWGIVMFVVCIKVLIPAFNPGGFTYSNDYAQSLHSANFVQAIGYIFTHPGNTMHLLYNNPIKRDTWFHLLAPVAFLCLASPIALLGLPMMLTRMLSDRDTEWGWHLYYDMPLMPIIFLGAVDGIMRLTKLTRWAMGKAQERRERRGVELELDGALRNPSAWALNERLFGGAFAVLALVIAVSNSRDMQLNTWARHDGFQSDKTWVAQVHQALAYVPAGVEVRATNNLTIPLANRNTVTLVGSHRDKGDWAAIDTQQPQCPIDPSKIPPYVADLKAKGFVTVKSVGPILIMHKP